MCKCGCNTCETKSTLMLNESLAPRGILSEGLKHHMDANKPLTDHLYRAGSDSYFNLWAEARSLYSRNILEITHEDDLAVLTETDLGHYGMFEGKKVPLDFPIELNEEANDSDLDNAIYRLENVLKYLDIEYKETRRGEKYVQIHYIPVTKPQSQNPEWVNVRYNNDEDLEIIKNRLDLSVLEQTYSGFNRNPEDPDSEPFQPTGSVAEFREDLRALFGKFKGDLKNPEFIKGVAQIMVNWKALLRSQLDENKKVLLGVVDENMLTEAEIDYEKEKTWGIQDKFPIEVTVKKGWTGNYYTIEPKPMDVSYDTFIDLGSGGNVDYTSYDYTTGEAQWTSDSLEQIKQWEEDNRDKIKVVYPNSLNEAKKKAKNNNKKLNKPTRDSSGGKAYKVYVKDPKTKKIKTVRFGSGGLRAKINDKKARNAFAARHKCSTKKDKTKAGYWSCRLPRYAKLLGLKSNFGGFW